jgi:hypothetical protein
LGSWTLGFGGCGKNGFFDGAERGTGSEGDMGGSCLGEGYGGCFAETFGGADDEDAFVEGSGICFGGNGTISVAVDFIGEGIIA